jgi:hypothetical protein
LSYGAISLEVPSWHWDYNRKLGIQGIAVDLKPEDAAGDTASVMVDRLPGLSSVIVGNVLGDLPDGAKVSKTDMTAFGALVGTGTRESVMLPGPTPQRVECVLFIPKGRLEGYYIFKMFSGPPAGDPIEKDLGNIAASIQGP